MGPSWATTRLQAILFPPLGLTGPLYTKRPARKASALKPFPLSQVVCRMKSCLAAGLLPSHVTAGSWK